MKDFKLDKTISRAGSYSDAEKDKLFPKETPLSERLRQAWYLTCMAYRLDPENPPKMEKRLTYMGKHR